MPEPGARARAYHESTKHSLERLRTARHMLDWENQPLPFKIYSGLEGRPLARVLVPGRTSAIRAMLDPPSPFRAGELPSTDAVARILQASLGIVRRRELDDGRIHYFRAAPCTGALYHVDAYLVCGDLPDVEAGVYHFGPQDAALRRLRSGDWRSVLAAATGGEESVIGAPLVLVLASTYWRNAWKYQARAYRHVFWDGGTIVAHVVAQAAADGWPVRVVAGFADEPVERLCALDPRREGVIALLPIGSGAVAASPREPERIELDSGAAPDSGTEPERIELATEPLSRHEIDYPEIREAHSAGTLSAGADARRWREMAPAAVAEGGGGLPLPPANDPEERPLEEVVVRRGSSRRFRTEPISLAALATILRCAAAPLSADYRSDPAEPLVDLFVIALAVDGLRPGRYRWRPRAGELELVSPAAERRDAGHLDLGQELAADAAANVYAIADLDRVLGALRDRGYRAAQLDGGISGGRAYLAAYALGLGATGLTFFDDDVAEYFGLDPRRWGVMFLTAVGVPAKPLLR